MAQINTLFPFTVRRRAPELICPAKDTPCELKLLSDIDDQDAFRNRVPVLMVYRDNSKMRNHNPVSVIKEALAKVLVFYYPFAGRLREGPARKLMVDCNGEGVLFIEADADITLKQFGEALHPPFPCLDELLYDVPGSFGTLNSPLLLIQVTRLLCGGFIFAIGHNHNMSDAFGIVQFMKALGEIARGESLPSTLPVWERELLNARDPPHVTCTHHEFDEMLNPNTDVTIRMNDMVLKSFFFGPIELLALHRFVPKHLKSCTTFDVVTTCLWLCRTIALQLDPEEESRIGFIVNARNKFSPPLPKGYYGNCSAFTVAISTVFDLLNKPFSHTLETLMKAKSSVNEEYMRSLADLLVLKGRLDVTVFQNYVVNDLTRARFDVVDFGWGKPDYGGSGKTGYLDCSNYHPYTNDKGESGILVPIYLPSFAMEKFVKQLKKMLAQDNSHQLLQANKLHAPSKL
uniref:benzyl alcohol O-benzoyltransferase-like n=1 Tax=Erigeron canadensis TaxID=72917 RepID=UPI001CB98C3B|nr:benzyl alcohol O-benzoyltransferase-like [Erigeron canadensis]